MRALEAQRLLDWITLRIAPALAAGLIAYSHVREPGGGIVVFAWVLAAGVLLERTRFPLHLMPAARLLVGLLTPVLGCLAAWATSHAAGEPGPVSQYEAMVLGAWLVTALGAWLRERLGDAIPARVAVIGPAGFAADLGAELTAAGIDAYRVVGWLGGPQPAELGGLRRLGSLEHVRPAVLAERIELLVVAPSAGDADSVFARVADQCLDLPVRLIAANQLYEETLGHVPIGTIDAAWYRYIMHPNFRVTAPASKRAFDLLVALAIGILAAPLLALAAGAVMLGGGGPVLYRQRRLGEHGRPFEILKLRTMAVDAEREGASWSGAGDPRVTRVGRLLRRTHVDELPQLWNVLRGEMTMVGPRPERPEIVSGLEGRFSHYSRRLLVKPGIAGWAALRCGYAGSELGTAWKLSHDLFYIKHRSALADAMILAETAVEVFRDAHRALRAPVERFLVDERARG